MSISVHDLIYLLEIHRSGRISASTRFCECAHLQIGKNSGRYHRKSKVFWQNEGIC